MRYSYDASVDALYVYLRDGATANQQVLSDGVVVDLGENGEVVGVEVLGARTAGWDPMQLRQQALQVDEYDMRALMVLASREGILRVEVGSTEAQQPAYTSDDLALAAG